jgi:bacillithiol synthase
MIKATLEPECTGQFSPCFLDYLQHKNSLQPFYSLFPSVENFGKLIQQKDFTSEKREVLVAALQDQYSSSGIEFDSIATLKQPNTFTVTTGHQLNLMTGPLYFIYKIVSTINLAERLKKEYPAHHFVPVYWMATEDHDFAEINHFHFDGEKYEWQSQQKGAVGEFVIDEELKSLLKDARFVPDFLKEAYLNSSNLADAVRRYVHHLFGEKGLVVVDGHDRELKRVFAPLMEADILEMKSSDLVQENTDALEALGYKTQVHAREINFFYLDKGLRERIIRKNGEFVINNTDLVFSEAELKKLLRDSPEKFSPNVVMRPMYQEVILPNLAYLGGPAEVVYWLQLKKAFDHYQVDFPMVMPRNFAMVIDARSARKIKDLGLGYGDLFEDFEKWKKAYVTKHSSHDLKLEKAKADLDKLLDGIKDEIATVHPTLEKTTESTRVRLQKIMDHFSKKVIRGEEKNFEEALQKMKSIKRTLFPKGIPQERHLNFLQFYLEDQSFVEELFSHFDPLDFNYVVLEAQNG